MNASEIKIIVNNYFQNKLKENPDYLKESNWLELACNWFEQNYDLNTPIYESCIGNFHDANMSCFITYAYETHRILYSIQYDWNDAVKEYSSIIDYDFPSIMRRIDRIKDRLIDGDNNTIWNDAKKIREYYDSNRRDIRRGKVERIINDLNKTKEHLYEFQKIL
jgi:hypothetical protein